MLYDDFLDEDALKTYAQNLNNRAKQARKAGTISLSSLRDRILESSGKCDWCAASILRQSFEIDHIIPLSNGGSHAGDNLAVACPDCNRSKASKHPARFAQETYARTGIMTQLLSRVLAYYEAEAKVQKSLFAPAQEESPQIFDSNIDDEPPPYIWGKPSE